MINSINFFLSQTKENVEEENVLGKPGCSLEKVIMTVNLLKGFCF